MTKDVVHGRMPLIPIPKQLTYVLQQQ